MSTQLILSFIADDRPGLVGMLSRAVTQSGGNWLESRMAHMAEKFAGIVRIDSPDAATAEAIKASLTALEAEGIRISIAQASKAAGLPGTPIVIELVGPDHPGIVRDITQCLAARNVSIEKMETHTDEAPMGGGILFHAHMEVLSPPGLDQGLLHGELEQIADALMVDLHLHPIGDGRSPAA